MESVLWRWRWFLLGCLLLLPGTEKPANSTDTSYTFDMTASKAVQKKGEIHLTITASKGYQIKPPSPLKIKLQPSKGVQLAKTKLGWDDAKVEKKKKVEVKTGYTLETSGTTQSTGAGEHPFRALRRQRLLPEKRQTPGGDSVEDRLHVQDVFFFGAKKALNFPHSFTETSKYPQRFQRSSPN